MCSLQALTPFFKTLATKNREIYRRIESSKSAIHANYPEKSKKEK